MRNAKKGESAAPGAAGRKRVGQVSPEERDQIRALFERKNALLELFRTLADADQVNDTIYERVVADLGKVTTQFNEWWTAKQKKYNWQGIAGGHWDIDFDDCSIYLSSHPTNATAGRGA